MCRVNKKFKFRWLAHWIESLEDKDLKIYRPKQLYIGDKELNFLPVGSRVEESNRDITTSVSSVTKRREV
jgi:citrate synthase